MQHTNSNFGNPPVAEMGSIHRKMVPKTLIFFFDVSVINSHSHDQWIKEQELTANAGMGMQSQEFRKC